MKKLTKQVPRRKLRSAEALAAWRLGHRVKLSKTIYSRKGRAKVRPELFLVGKTSMLDQERCAAAAGSRPASMAG